MGVMSISATPAGINPDARCAPRTDGEEAQAPSETAMRVTTAANVARNITLHSTARIRGSNRRRSAPLDSEIVVANIIRRLSGWSLTAVEVSYGPGEESGAHRHPGLTIAYVLEGSIRSKVGDAAEQTYTAGQMFIEAPEQVHAVSRNASNTESAKLLAILLTRKGAVLTTPVKQ